MRGFFGLIVVLLVGGLLALGFQSRFVRPAGLGTPSRVAASSMASGARALPGLQPSPLIAPTNCAAPARFASSAETNAASLIALSWSPFHRSETGWAIYAPLIGHEIGSACPPTSPAFAAALAAWQAAHAETADGRMRPDTFAAMVTIWHSRRPFVAASAHGACPAPPPASGLETALPAEGYAGKSVSATPGALAAYRRMVAAARAEQPALAADPRLLTIFSAYRSPLSDGIRCLLENNCDGVVRATCSAHRTGTAFDLYLGSAPGIRPESAEDANRLFASRTPAYHWLVWNAGRFGFVNYPFEPWHWEWAGPPP